MTRIVRVGAAQLGPIQREHTRQQVVERLLALLAEAGSRGCDLVVYPELALTTFFPRWFVDDIAEALARLKSRGVRLIDESPRPGAHGSLVAFIHPSSAHGVLVELKQTTRP